VLSLAVISFPSDREGSQVELVLEIKLVTKDVPNGGSDIVLVLQVRTGQKAGLGERSRV